MSSIRLDGKVAVVTGATQGIGRAVALDLAARGVHVVGTARNAEPAAELAAQAQARGGKFTFVSADVSRWAECKEAAEAALAAGGGRIDILVNNAGISRPHRRLDEIELDDWRAVSGSTLEGTIAMSRYVLPGMIAQRDGVIVHIASVSALIGLDSFGAYCMAKSAVVQHAKVCAVENVKHGVRCHALLVGATETEAMKRSLLSQARLRHGPDWEPPEDFQSGADSLRILQPESVARAVALLCSEEAREINGGTIAIDRGISSGIFTSEYNRLVASGAIPELVAS